MLRLRQIALVAHDPRAPSSPTPAPSSASPSRSTTPRSHVRPAQRRDAGRQAVHRGRRAHPRGHCRRPVPRAPPGRRWLHGDPPERRPPVAQGSDQRARGALRARARRPRVLRLPAPPARHRRQLPRDRRAARWRVDLDGPWEPAGPNWQAAKTETTLGIVAAEIQSADPAALGRPLEQHPRSPGDDRGARRRDGPRDRARQRDAAVRRGRRRARRGPRRHRRRGRRPQRGARHCATAPLACCATAW